MADARRPGSRVVYRCSGCGFEFGVGTAGATPCPRCGSIGGHDRVATVHGDSLGEESDGGHCDGHPR